MKKFTLLLALLLLSVIPALAETVDTLPVPKGATLLDGWTGEKTAMHLMEKPDGTTVLACFVRTEEGWARTESTPLPQGTAIAVKYAQEGCIQLHLPIRTDEVAFHGMMVDTEIRLVDGTWQVTGLMCPLLWMDFRENGILGPECAWYGDVTFDGDVTRIDWTALPGDEEACLTLLDVSQWRYLAEDAPALRERMNGMEAVTDLYRRGTPVRIERYSADGKRALAAVLGGDVRVWLPVESLQSAEGHVQIDSYVGVINPLTWGAPTIEFTPEAGVPLYDVPGGEPIHTLAAGELHLLRILADCAEGGWFHVEDEWEGVDGYVHAGDLPPYEAIVAAKRLLPEYIFRSGSANREHAAFIMINLAGETVFVGCSSTKEGWVFSESQPLPKGSVCDDYHSAGSSFILQFPHPEGVENRWEEGVPVWIDVVAYPQEDGRWLVETIMNENEEGFHINEDGFPGYYINMTGMVYGTVTFERDMRHIDWNNFPLCLEEALAYLADDMGVIGADVLPLYADAACTEVIAEYRFATPVAILDREGSMARVRIADSDITGWVDAASLLTGRAQLVPYEGDPEDLVTAEWYADAFTVPAGTAYYDAPDGLALGTTEFRESFTLMAVYGDWCHVCFGESLESCWVRMADGVFSACREPLPVPEGAALLDGWTGEKTAMHLMAKPDGTTVFAGFVCTADGWVLTESTPLPADAPAALDTYHAGEGGIEVYLHLPQSRRAYEDVDVLEVLIEWDPERGTWAVTCINTGWEVIAIRRHSIYDDLGFPFYGDVTLPADVTHLDWTALPASFDEAMALVDTSRWAIVTRDDAAVQAEDGSTLLYALEGAPVTILDRRDGMTHIALMDSGVTGWIADDDLLPASEQMAWNEEWECWENRHIPQESIITTEEVALTAVLHDESTSAPMVRDWVENLTLLGRCPEGCCFLVYWETTGEVAWTKADCLPEF